MSTTPNVLHLCRRLKAPPDGLTHPHVQVRHFAGEADIAPWLELRHQAFARQRIGVRQWSPEDFRIEFVRRWWWRPECMWLAEVPPAPLADSSQHRLVGAVTLAMRGQPDHARPVVHWLMVLPAWRRRGVGQLLLAHLEAAAWHAGHRQIWLETHAAWSAAVTFYEASGYTPDKY